MSWRLVDGEKREREHPGSFDMPDRDVRNQLDAKGPDKVLVKLLFETDEPCKKGRFKGATGERMWVIVKGKGRNKRYLGELNNHPHFIKGLNVGQSVEFDPENVICVDLMPTAQEELARSRVEKELWNVN